MRESYENPLVSRWGSAEMSALFSPDRKFRTWRRLWIALARAEKALGLPITDEQVAELERFRDDINYDVAEAREKETRHDVMAHVRAYGVQAPKARPIIHLGATSAYVGDNTDLIVMREALGLVAKRIGAVVGGALGVRETVRGAPDARLHALPAGATHHGRQARVPLDAGRPLRPRQCHAARARDAASGRQGDDRHTGEFPRALRGRRREGQGARPARGAGDGLSSASST